MQNKKIVYIVAAVALGIVSIFLIHTQLQEKERVIRQLYESGKLTEVVVARRDIPKTSPIRPNMVELIKVPANEVRPGAVTSVNSVLSKVATVDILTDQIIYSSMLRLPEQAQSVAQKIAPGKRAFTVAIDKISAVGGEIRSGDKVDIVGILGIPQQIGDQQIMQRVVMTLFENVAVLDAGSGEKGLDSITFALTAEETRILNYSLELGAIKLVLRSPLDAAAQGTFQPFTFESFMQKIYAAMGGRPQPPAMPQPPQKTEVEVYRGGN